MPLRSNQSNAGAAFAKLLIKHQPSVYVYVRSMVYFSPDVEDILQDVATVAWQKFETYDPDRPFDVWLCGIAHRIVLAYYRTKQKDRLRFSSETLELLSQDAIDSAQDASQSQEALDLCLSKLADTDHDLIRKRFANGATNRSVAAQMGWTDSKISRQLSRIYALLHQCIRRQLATEDLT
ncbi:MAG: sigma-70 family RNA polymerase sigma factor [Phycisphaeraceae bacterium]|nr:sigma-70 family RNA polymerase sigma factor [Phycisphaeraceae bacterium]